MKSKEYENITMQMDEESVAAVRVEKFEVLADPDVDKIICAVSFFKEKNIPVMEILTVNEENAHSVGGGMNGAKRIYQMDTPIRQSFHVEYEDGSPTVFIRGDLWNAFRIIKDTKIFHFSTDLIQKIETNSQINDFIEASSGFTFKNKFQTLVMSLACIETVEAIERVATERNGTTICLCAPRDSWKWRTLHLAIYPPIAQTEDLTEKVSISLGYNAAKKGKRVTWHTSGENAEEFFEKSVAITKENFENKKISGFFEENYAGFARLFREKGPFEEVNDTGEFQDESRLRK